MSRQIPTVLLRDGAVTAPARRAGRMTVALLMVGLGYAAAGRASKDEEPRTVVFVCEHGSAKSLAAASIFERMAKERGLALRAVSRGTAPDASVPDAVVAALGDDGFDVAGFKPQGLTEADVRAAERVVAIGVDLGEVGGKAGRGVVARWDDIPPFSASYPMARQALQSRIASLLLELEGAPAPPLRLASPALTVGLVPGLGGRIVELRADAGENLLDADSRFWKEPYPPAELRTPFEAWNGHTYWVGPQSAWWTQQELDPERRKAKATWPPDPFHETARYEVRERSPARVRLESPPSQVTGLSRQLEVELVGPRRVRIRVTGTNVRTSPVAWSFYSNTRVRPEGWVYVRLAPDGIKRIDGLREESAAYPHRLVRGFFVSPPGVAAAPAGKARTADVSLRPAAAEIAYFRGHQLLLKRAETFKEARLHPEETLVEIYRSSGSGREARLLELELHGPFESLGPGQSMTFEETWEIRDYPGPPVTGAQLDFLDRLGG